LADKLQRYDSATNLKGYSENLRKSIKNTTTVSEGGIESKINSLEYPDITEAMLIANEECFKPFIKNYCFKSGKFLHNYSLERFSDMLAIHGKEKTLSLLIQLATSNYSVEWMSTDSQTLNKLMIQDANGYFIFAANHLFLQAKPKSACANLSFEAVPQQYKELFLRLQDKQTARYNLECLQGEYLDLILEANELIRRLIGLAKPTKSMLTAFFTFDNLIDATKDKQSLIIFIEDIKENLTFLLQRHFKNVRSKIIQQQADLYKITANDIEKIMRELNGLKSFHNQPSIKNQPKRISVMLDLQEFVIDEFGESELWEDLSVFDMKPQKEEQILLNNFSLDGDFMGLKENEKAKEANAGEANAKPTPKPKIDILNLTDKAKDKTNTVTKTGGFKLNL